MAGRATRNSNAVASRGPSFVAPPMWDPEDGPGPFLTNEERAFLALNATIVRYRKGEDIFNEGDAASAVFGIVNGAVKLYKLQAGRKQHIVRFMFDNDLIGLAERGKYVNSAKSIIDTVLYRMPTRGLETRLRQSPGLEFRVITKLCHDLRRTQEHALLISKHRASAKLGMFIQILASQQNPVGTEDIQIYLPMTRADIGAYVGLSPEAVSRGIAELVGRDAVAFGDRRHLKILDRAMLDSIVAETERPQEPH